METTYRVEFNQHQQCFHFADHSDEANTNGWVTVIENCTDLEYLVFKAYYNRITQERITLEYLLQCVSEVESFMNKLIEYGLVVSYS